MRARRLAAVTTILALACMACARGDGARPGEAAPYFALKDLNGKEHKLADYRGKIVVLEWTNYTCPAVAAYYDTRIMSRTRARFEKDPVAWLLVDSSHFCESQREAVRRWYDTNEIRCPLLLDAPGTVGHAYGATTTPHMFVIDQQGKLAYAGALDEATRAENRRNYVVEAVSALLKNEAPPLRQSQPRGCSVKYAPNAAAANTSAATPEAGGQDTQPVVAGRARESDVSPTLYVCPPCGARCHDRSWEQPGACTVCGMTLIKLVSTEAFEAGKEAEKQYEAGEWEKAIAACRRQTKADPRNGHAWLRAGVCHQKLGRLDEALEAYRTAAQLDGIRGPAFYRVACVLSLKGQKDEAFAALGQAVDGGYRGDGIVADPNLDNVRRDPRFRRILARIDDAIEQEAQADENAAAPPPQDAPRPTAVEPAGGGQSAGHSAPAGGAQAVGPTALVATAATHTRERRFEEALDALGQAVQAGHATIADVLSNTEFDGLRIDPTARRRLRRLLRESPAQTRVALVSDAEPGTRVTVRGVVKSARDGEPLGGALLYVYQTDDAGLYAPEQPRSGGGSDNARLFAFVKADTQGRFELDTVLPGRYPGGAAPPRHIHYRLSAPQHRESTSEFLFDQNAEPSDSDRARAKQSGFPLVTAKPTADGRLACDVVLTLATE